MVVQIAVIPKTRPILAIFDPITLLIAISGEPLRTAFKLTKSSGIEVAKETTVSPITIFDRFNLNERLTDARTRKSPPITRRTKPKSIKTISIEIIFNEDKLRFQNS